MQFPIQFQKNAYTQKQIDEIRQKALTWLDEPMPELTYRDFSAYWNNGGVRLDFDRKYFDRRGRLLVFSVMAFMEPDEEKWLNAFCETVWAICSEPFWCIPAHFFDERHRPLPFERFENHLDLFSCETASALAEARNLLIGRLPEMIDKQIRLQVEKRVFQPWLDPNTHYFFEHFPNNWPSVCSSSIGSAALYLIDDDEKLNRILERCFRAQEVYFSSYGPDGICSEGADYFSYGFGLFTCFADLLYQKTQGKTDLFSREIVRKAAECQNWYYLSGKEVLNFGDTRDTVRCRMGISCYLARRFEIPVPPAAEEILYDHCFRYALALRDLMWTDRDKAEDYPNSWHFAESTQWFFSRYQGITMITKGGKNGQAHSHHDSGSLVVYKNGKQCLCDPGAGQYTAQYFSPQRYELFAASSISHNVPVISGKPQGIGQSKLLRSEETDGVRIFSLEMKDLYPEETHLNSLIRNLEHREDGSILLTDTASFTQPGEMEEHFVSTEPIQVEAGHATFTKDGEELPLYFDPSLHFDVQKESFVEIDNHTKTVWLLTIKGDKNTEQSFQIQIGGKKE